MERLLSKLLAHIHFDVKMEARPEDKTEKNSKTEAKIETEPKTEAKTENETRIKPRTLLKVVIDEPSPMPITTQMLLALKDQEFTMEEVWNLQQIYMLLGKHGLDQVIKKAESRYDKWFRKVGNKFSETAQTKMRENLHLYALLEHCISTSLDYFGVGGTLRGYYRSFSFNVMKKLARNEPSGWLKQAYDRLKAWTTVPELNSDILKTLTWITLKTLAFWYEKTRP
jgi:hypothetical protein